MNQTNLELRRVLEEGYQLQYKWKAYRSPFIPKVEDPEFHSFGQSMAEHLRQNGLPKDDLIVWAQKLEETFADQRLNFGRFKHITESNSDSERDSLTKIFKRQLDELDKILNIPGHIDSYRLILSYPEVQFENKTISQGYGKHSFRDPLYIALINNLWEKREIKNMKGEILKNGKPISRRELFERLKIDQQRFTDIVRGIHVEMKRKSINLKIKYPNKVLIVVKQDSM